MKLSQIYQTMRSRDLVSGRADFSAQWLGAAADHFSNKYDRISLKSRVHLFVKLRDAGHDDLAADVFALLRASVSA